MTSGNPFGDHLTPMSGTGGAQGLKLTSTADSYNQAIQSVPIKSVEPMTFSGRYDSTRATGYTKVVIHPFGLERSRRTRT